MVQQKTEPISNKQKLYNYIYKQFADLANNYIGESIGHLGQLESAIYQLRREIEYQKLLPYGVILHTQVTHDHTLKL